jgi:ADP-ribose pyrophosphatase
MEKTLEKRTIYKGRILNVKTDTVLCANGRTAFREVIEHHGGAAVAALNEKGEIYLVRQYRYPYGEYLLEIPAGKLNAGENPEECAARELTEETGLIAEKLELLNVIYPSPGYTNEKLYVYEASGLSRGKTNFDLDEDIENITLPLVEAVRMADSGELKDCKTVIAIYRLARRKI